MIGVPVSSTTSSFNNRLSGSISRGVSSDNLVFRGRHLSVRRVATGPVRILVDGPDRKVDFELCRIQAGAGRLLSMTATLIIPLTPLCFNSPHPRRRCSEALQTGSWRAWLDCPGGELPRPNRRLTQARQGLTGWIGDHAEHVKIPARHVGWDGTDPRLSRTTISTIRRKDELKTGAATSTAVRGESERKADRGPSCRFTQPLGPADRFPHAAWDRSPHAGDDRRPLVRQVRVGRGPGRRRLRSLVIAARRDRHLLDDDRRHDRSRGRFRRGAACNCQLLTRTRALLQRAASKPTGRSRATSGRATRSTTRGRRQSRPQSRTARRLHAYEANRQLRFLAKMAFPDLEGQAADAGRPGVFRQSEDHRSSLGSWCPNRHDASNYLADLHRRMHGMRTFGRRSGVRVNRRSEAATPNRSRRSPRCTKSSTHSYRAGVSDREKASAALPMLDKIAAYPTPIVLDRETERRAVYTGFSGPATGDEYKACRDQVRRSSRNCRSRKRARWCRQYHAKKATSPGGQSFPRPRRSNPLAGSGTGNNGQIVDSNVLRPLSEMTSRSTGCEKVAVRYRTIPRPCRE